MSTNNTSCEEVLSLEEMIAKAIEGRDTSANPDVKVESGGSLRTKSSSEAQRSPWDIEELIEKIWQCIVILEHDVQKITGRAVFNLLGVNLNSYVWVNNEKVTISQVIKRVKEYKKVISSPELIDRPITSGILITTGETIDYYIQNIHKPNYDDLKLTPNQILHSKFGHPIFIDIINEPFQIGTCDECTNPTELMAYSLHNALVKRRWFHHAMKRENSFTYAKHLNNLIKEIARSERVYSKNKSMDYLLRKDRNYAFLKLIERPSGQKAYPGTPSYKYKYTPELEQIITEAVELFLQLELTIFDGQQNDSDIMMTPQMLKEINYRDIFILLNHLKGIDGEGNYIIDNASTITDKQDSRVYSLMTTVKSETRRILGFVNYDISACMQTILAHYVDMDTYPLHQALIKNKRAFRGQIGIELEKDYDKVKEILSAADNGKKYKTDSERSKTLKQYIIEAEPMVDDFTEIIKNDKPNMYQTARSHAKYEYDRVWKENPKTGKQELDLIPVDLKKFSVFFFIWTQIERQIRHAMMSCFDGFVHEVHDAVYSKEVLDTTVLEKAVLAQTNIVVKIEH